jgi:hypothetical protein
MFPIQVPGALNQSVTIDTIALPSSPLSVTIFACPTGADPTPDNMTSCGTVTLVSSVFKPSENTSTNPIPVKMELSQEVVTVGEYFNCTITIDHRISGDNYVYVACNRPELLHPEDGGGWPHKFEIEAGDHGDLKIKALPIAPPGVKKETKVLIYAYERGKPYNHTAAATIFIQAP